MAASSKRRLIIALALLIPASCLGIGGLGVYLARGEEITVSDADRSALFTVEDAGLSPIVGAGAVRKMRRFDGSTELTYRYQQPAKIVQCTISVSPDVDTAAAVYPALLKAFRLGIAASTNGKGTLEEAPRMLRWGDQSDALVLRVADRSVGYVFMARRGARAVQVAVLGEEAVFDERAKAALLARLDRIDAVE